MFFKYSFFLFFLLAINQKEYVKNYNDNGILKSEGWIQNKKKVDFWLFYYNNSAIKKKGHFNNGKESGYWYFYNQENKKTKEGHYIYGNKEKWWIFFNEVEEVSYKCQFKNNKKNGYCLIYKNNDLVKASKFKDDKLIKEWNDFASFRKENNLSDLRQ